MLIVTLMFALIFAPLEWLIDDITCVIGAVYDCPLTVQAVNLGEDPVVETERELQHVMVFVARVVAALLPSFVWIVSVLEGLLKFAV